MKGLLLRAMESGEVLEMIYLSDKGVISQRIIKIIDVSNEVFTAYCFLRHKPRVFKLTNILSIGPEKKKYKRGA
jgi:predicted DNA-binding transcriptional regulator YafY